MKLKSGALIKWLNGLSSVTNPKATSLNLTESSGSQQQIYVTSRVSDFSGTPLPGVTVVVKGTTQSGWRLVNLQLYF